MKNLILAVLAIGLATSSAHAQQVNEEKGCVVVGSVPGPFSDTNRKVELADGETYALFGVVKIGSVPGAFFVPGIEVDLKIHPWLASELRRDNPFYPLKGSADFWKAFMGKKIKVYVRASSIISSDRHGHPVVVKMLEALD